MNEGIGAGRAHREGTQDLVVGALAQRQDGLSLGHRRDLRQQEWPAGREFGRRRLVLGWKASHGIGDPAVDQAQPIGGIGAKGADGEAELEQGGVEEVAGIVASEGPAGAVGAAHAWRQSEDQQTRVQSAERTDRGVLPIGMEDTKFVQECNEPGAARTIERRLLEMRRGHGTTGASSNASATRTGRRRDRHPLRLR